MQGLSTQPDAAAAAAAAAHESCGEDDDSSDAESEVGEEAYDSCSSAASYVSFAGCESATDDEDDGKPQGEDAEQPPAEVRCGPLFSGAAGCYPCLPWLRISFCHGLY